MLLRPVDVLSLGGKQGSDYFRHPYQNLLP
jgi:hypothetical protein